MGTVLFFKWGRFYFCRIRSPNRPFVKRSLHLTENRNCPHLKNRTVPNFLFNDGAGKDEDQSFVAAIQLGDADNGSFATFYTQCSLN
jgi:hypothetical protein